MLMYLEVTNFLISNYQILIRNMFIISELVGDFARYQTYICLLIFLSKFCAAFHQFAILFLAPPVGYTCPDYNITSCCESAIYNTTVFSRTIVMEWNLICGKSWLKDLTQTLFQFGVLLGSLIFGILSDKYGRRITLNTSVLMLLFSGILATFAPDYWSFTIVRMIVGISVGGIMVVGFVLIIELVGNKNRALVSALYQLPFTIGSLLLVAFGYYLRDYTYFQLAISLSTLILLPYICLLPESPRWLIAVNKIIIAAKTLKKMARINKMPTDNILEQLELYQAQQLQAAGKKGSVLALFRTPNLRKHILIMSFNWFVCSYCYYGISQYISHLSGNIFLNVTASGVVAICAVVISIPLMKKLGRKPIVIYLNIACGATLLIIAVIPKGLATLILGCFCVLCSFIVFVVVYLFCTEMFPTVVRNGAIGISSMMARLGAMLAPFIVSLEEYESWYTPVTFAIFPLLAALSCVMLPETKDCELLTTLEEGENFGKSVGVI